MPRKQRYLVIDTMIEHVLTNRGDAGLPTSAKELVAAIRAQYPDVEPFMVMGFTIDEAVQGFEAYIVGRRLRAAWVRVTFQGKVIRVRKYLHFGREWGQFWHEWSLLNTDEERQHVIDLANACLDERMGQERSQKANSGDIGQIKLLRRFLKALQQGAFAQLDLEGHYNIVLPRKDRSA